MGRPERPIDPDAGPLPCFAFELRQLRKAAGGPTYRQLAERAHYSVTALAEAAGGRRLPTLAVTVAYVEACGGDRNAWAARWHAVAAAGRSVAAADVRAEPDASDAPYLGLVAFQPDDAHRFFGRERLIGELVDRLAQARFLAVFGASGSGKSSLIRAGLLPAVQAGGLPGSRDWPCALLTPGEHPLGELATQLAALGGANPTVLRTGLAADPACLDLAVREALAAYPEAAELLLVVDQFEEVFTLCRHEGERARFIDALLCPARKGTSRLRVVLGVRADFYPRCADYPELVVALRDAQVLVGSMTTNELRGAIRGPADRAGLEVEPALVATILAEVGGRPGALPLLSHALWETWRRRRGSRLALASYQGVGGVNGAISQTAEAVYARLDAAQQRIARRLFLRLTAFGRGTEDIRRRARRAELLAGRDAGSVEVVLDRLVSARLVTQGEASAEVAHEALIREWPRLRRWLTEDGEGRRAHRQLTAPAQAWAVIDLERGSPTSGTSHGRRQRWVNPMSS